MSFDWAYLDSGLGLRQDEFSWQGSFKDDPRFYLRRDVDNPNDITDLLLGNVEEAVASKLLAEFLVATGGLVLSSPLVLKAIANDSHDFNDVVAKFDQLVGVTTIALESIGLRKLNATLQDDLGRWNAVVIFSD